MVWGSRNRGVQLTRRGEILVRGSLNEPAIMRGGGEEVGREERIDKGPFNGV